MRILVLGGTGAMGKPVVEILARRGHDVFVTSRKQHAEENPHIKYILGNANDDDIIKQILNKPYDAIIDFMVYTTQKFESRVNLLLDSTKQYLFLSSARVYADQGKRKITEQSPRLLDTTNDIEYKKTDEYALAKAREENILLDSQNKNWTIIRPYITYNDERLQLGVLEKEMWLYRALRGKSIVFSQDIADHVTTLTYGYDVALRIADLIGKEEALGEVFHITTDESICWSQVLDIYLQTVEKVIGKRPKVYMLRDASLIAKVCHNQYQIKYDRLFDRKFDNQKIQDVTREERLFLPAEVGLKKCLEQFIKKNTEFRSINWRLEGAMDKLSGEKERIRNIPGYKNKGRYILHRYIKS